MRPAKELDEAFRDLEPLICDLANAVMLLIYIMEAELSGTKAAAPLPSAVRGECFSSAPMK